MNDKLEKYQLLYLKLSGLKSELDTLGKEILADLDKTNSKRLSTSYGLFVVREYRHWHYSETIILSEQKLKLKKKKEEETGRATFDVTNSLMYRKVGEEK